MKVRGDKVDLVIAADDADGGGGEDGLILYLLCNNY